MPKTRRETRFPSPHDPALQDRLKIAFNSVWKTSNLESSTPKSALSNESGGEVLEYALIAGLIVVAAIAVIGSVGGKVFASWNSLNSSVWTPALASSENPVAVATAKVAVGASHSGHVDCWVRPLQPQNRSESLLSPISASQMIRRSYATHFCEDLYRKNSS